MGTAPAEGPRRVILDCDPGHDDALALLAAWACPEIELVGITTVAGNQTLDKVTLNARRVCTVAGITVPICAGSPAPLLRDLVTGEGMHGGSGLDGHRFGTPTVPAGDEHAVDFIVREVMASPGEITLVPIGPLTNVALALRREPALADRVREVVLMGGAATRGNRTPAAEANVAVDPEAAAIVFGAGWPLTMVGLDCTRQSGLAPETLGRLRELDSEVARMVTDLLTFYGDAWARAGGDGGPPVHDPCALARVARPDLVGVRDAFVAVETRGAWTTGMTVVDFTGRLGRPPNAKVAVDLDRRGLWDLLVGAVAALSP